MGVLLAFLAGGVAMGIGALYSTGSADLPVQDQQPLSFSHRLHAGTLNINCQFCHRYATQSLVAGVPSMALCQTCHQSIKNTTPDLQKFQTFWNQNRPIRWVRLQRLPDHVYFTHEMHLLAGLSCTSCHGKVSRMSHTPRAPSYEMGWCLTCHQQRGASQDCWTCHK
ncbi:MAG TPA: cytochrome c3 family protein [Nitrospirales bacterium]|nr:cytochrome c3 family protein [Nitrospirales bacterium]